MTLQDDFWNDPQHAQTLIRQLNGIKDIVESYEKLNSALIGLEETHDLLKEDYDDEIFELFEAEYLEMEKNFDDFEIKILLSMNMIIPVQSWSCIREPVEQNPVTGRICCIACIPAGLRKKASRSVCWIIFPEMRQGSNP